MLIRLTGGNGKPVLLESELIDLVDSGMRDTIEKEGIGKESITVVSLKKDMGKIIVKDTTESIADMVMGKAPNINVLMDLLAEPMWETVVSGPGIFCQQMNELAMFVDGLMPEKLVTCEYRRKVARGLDKRAKEILDFIRPFCEEGKLK